MKRSGSPLVHLLVTAIAVVLSLGLAELAFRALDVLPAERRAAAEALSGPQGSVAPETPTEDELQEPSAHWVVHPYRGISPRPGITTDTGRTLYNVLGINSQSPDPRELPEEDLVVGIFGGSVATGMGLTSARFLEPVLAEAYGPEARVRVINFGISGYKQPQQLFLLSELRLLGVPIDLVINLDGFNELVLARGNAGQGRHPLYPSYRFWMAGLGAATGSLSRAQVRLLGQMESARSRAEESEEALRRSPLGFSALARAWWGGRILAARGEASAAEDRMRSLPIRKPEEDLWHLEDPCTAEPLPCQAKAIETWKESSRLMQTVARHMGARYLHVLQPNQYLAGSKELIPAERARAWAPEQPMSVLAAEGYPALREAGRELAAEGIPFLDATQIFRGSRDEDYTDVCCHLTHLGYRKLAEEIGRFWVQTLAAQPVDGRRPEPR